MAHLYALARHGEIDRNEARAQLDHMRALNIRLLGDRALQKFAWDIAELLRWEDTYMAECVALTKLQTDAFVTVDPGLARAAARLVPIASYEEMVGRTAAQPSP